MVIIIIISIVVVIIIIIIIIDKTGCTGNFSKLLLHDIQNIRSSGMYAQGSAQSDQCIYSVNELIKPTRIWSSLFISFMFYLFIYYFFTFDELEWCLMLFNVFHFYFFY